MALTFDPNEDIAAPYVARGARPAVAILREQGVNSQVETAAVFERAGFEPHDVHMTDLLRGRDARWRISRPRRLRRVSPTATCWAPARAGPSPSCSTTQRASSSQRFFARADTFALGMCNGCQMFAALKELIPGSAHWPRFVRNRSEQYEARLTLVEILRSPSVVLRRHGGFVLADRGGARRGPGGVRLCGSRGGLRAERLDCLPLRQSRSHRGEHLSLQSERLASGNRGAVERRRTRHHYDATSREVHPVCAELLAT